MKKIISLVLATVLLLGIVGSMAGCGKKDTEIRIYLGDQVYDFDPALAFVDDNVSRVMGLLFEPLFLLDEDGDVEYGLAESYEIIEDEERGEYKMEIKLRDSYWNDGKTKVTADDVSFAWKRILDPQFPSQAAPLLYDIKNAAAIKQDVLGISRDDLGLEANRDTLTITFEGKIDYDAFLRNLTSVALVPLRANKIAQDADLPGEAYFGKRAAYIATNGMFAIRSWNRGTGEFTLQRNDYYHVENPEENERVEGVYPSKLQMNWTDEKFEQRYSGNMNKFLKDKMANFGKLAEVAEDAVFCVGVLPAEKEIRLEYLEDAEIFDAFSTYTYIFNTNKAPFDNENVRRAFSMVLDREYLAEQLVYAKAADGFISPAVWDSVKKKTSFRSEAESLIVTTAKLEEAKALVASVDKSAPVTLTVRNDAEERLIAKHAKAQWEKLGFTVVLNVVTVDTQVWVEEENKGDYKLGIEGIPGREIVLGKDPNAEKQNTMVVYDDAIQAAYATGSFDILGVDYNMYSTNAFTALCGFTTLLNGNGVAYSVDEETGSSAVERLHCSGFSDAAYDAIMDRALAEKDLEKRAAILHEAEEYLISKMPIVPVVYNQLYYVVEEIRGLDFDGYGAPVFTKASLTVDMPEAAPAGKED